MGDDTAAKRVASVSPDGEPPRTPAGIWEHYCEHEGCTKWGGWGFLKRGGQVWFCFEHRADGEV